MSTSTSAASTSLAAPTLIQLAQFTFPTRWSPSLAGYTSFDHILITSATMPGGATLSLNLIGSNAVA